MSRSLKWTLSLLVVGIALTLVWLATVLDPSGGPEAPADRGSASVVDPRSGPNTVKSALELGNEAEARAVVARAEAKTSTAAESPIDDSELADATWVEGRVVFPNETPVDERVFVVAQGRKFQNRPFHRVEVGRDGRFRVAFSKKTQKGTLDLEARYLYLAEPPTLVMSELPQEVVLEPLVGGCLRVSCTLPPGRDALLSAAQGASVLLDTDRANLRAGHRPRKLGDDLTAELGGLSAADDYVLRVMPKALCEARAASLRVEIGKVTLVPIELHEGVRLRVRVVDESGHGVAKAGFAIRSGNSTRSGQFSADDDGVCEFSGLKPPGFALTAIMAGYLSATKTFEGLSDGDVRDEVMTLSRGGRIAGRVQWPDGKPAAGAWVRAEPSTGTPYAERDDWGEKSNQSAADGSFEITGLATGHYDLKTQDRPEDVAATRAGSSAGDAGGGSAASEPGKTAESSPDPKAVKRAKKLRGAPWNASANRVETGTSNLMLVLQPGNTLTGRVLDDTGAPVAKFRVSAQPVRKDSFSFEQGEVKQQSVGDPEGNWTLDGLPDGDWRIRADVDGLTSNSEQATLPGPHARIDLVLPRPSTLRGIVVDPAGVPVAGARVMPLPTQQETLYGINARELTTTSEAQGRFVFAKAPAGKLRLVATHADWAQSAPLAVDATPGAPSDGLTLRLLVGGRVDGRVFDDLGGPEANRTVRGWCSEKVDAQSVVTDAGGRFSLEHVPPGTWQFYPDPCEGETAPMSRRASVTVADGEIVTVTIGDELRDPVHLSGRVRRGSAPGAGLTVHAQPVMDRGWEHGRQATCDETGQYQLLLPTAGSWMVSVSTSDGTSQSKSLEIEKGGSATLDFQFASGSVSGRVAYRSGEPAVASQVTLQLERGVARDGGPAAFGNVRTKSDGSFEFTDVSPGTYRVDAMAGNGWAGETASHATTGRGGIVLADGARATGIDIVVDLAASLKMTVRPSPGETGDVLISVVDERGERASAWARPMPTPGKFEINTLAPGRYFVGARAGEFVTAHPVSVELESKGTREIALDLVRGARLDVTLTDPAGQPSKGNVRIRDERGFELTGMYWPLPRPEGGYRFDVLPPGTYSIEARNRDGDAARQTITIQGTSPQNVALRYGG